MDTQQNAKLLQELASMIYEQLRWIEKAQQEVERLKKWQAQFTAKFKLPDVIGNSSKCQHEETEITLTAKAVHMPMINQWIWFIVDESGDVWDGDDSFSSDAAYALEQANAQLARMVAVGPNPGNGTEDGIPFA